MHAGGCEGVPLSNTQPGHVERLRAILDHVTAWAEANPDDDGAASVLADPDAVQFQRSLDRQHANERRGRERRRGP